MHVVHPRSYLALLRGALWLSGAAAASWLLSSSSSSSSSLHEPADDDPADPRSAPAALLRGSGRSRRRSRFHLRPLGMAGPVTKHSPWGSVPLSLSLSFGRGRGKWRTRESGALEVAGAGADDVGAPGPLISCCARDHQRGRGSPPIHLQLVWKRARCLQRAGRGRSNQRAPRERGGKVGFRGRTGWLVQL